MAWVDATDPLYDPSKACPQCGDMSTPCYCGWIPHNIDELRAECDRLNEAEGRTEPAARLQGERLAFREWNVGPGLELCSTARGEPWTLEMVAACPTEHQHTDEFSVWQRRVLIASGESEHERKPSHAPSMDCECGLYAFYHFNGVRYGNGETHVFGAIVVSGRVLLGPTGVRAEKARIVLLAYGSERQRVLAEGAAKKLGVGCCKFEDLERLALEYGQPVPDDQKPQMEEGISDHQSARQMGRIAITGNVIHIPPGTHLVSGHFHMAAPSSDYGTAPRGITAPVGLASAGGVLALIAGILHGLGGI